MNCRNFGAISRSTRDAPEMAARLAGMDRQAQKVAQAAPSRAAKIAG
eukprot:COSAG06_NODE_5085_length_3733_cov_22.728949_7_plen_46_part_01